LCTFKKLTKACNPVSPMDIRLLLFHNCQRWEYISLPIFF